MEKSKTQKEFRAVESLLTNTKNLCDSLLMDNQNLELTLCEVRQERVKIKASNLSSMDDKKFLSFVKNDLLKLFENEQDQLLDIWKWLGIWERAEVYLSSNNSNNDDEIAATHCKNEIGELNELADKYHGIIRRNDIGIHISQNDIDTFFYRKRRVQGILNVLSISKSLTNNYLVDFPENNPEFKRTLDMIIGLFSYSEIFSENFIYKIDERLRRIKAEETICKVQKTIKESHLINQEQTA